MYLILYLITPTLGFLKNYIKYKQCNLFTYLRTPFIYYFIHYSLFLLNIQNRLYLTIILERWFFFFYKICLSYLRDDYHLKKDKYIKKYGIQYE